MLHGSLFADNARHFFFLYMEYQSLIIPPPYNYKRWYHDTPECFAPRVGDESKRTCGYIVLAKGTVLGYGHWGWC
jgi:hypothetical protein